MFEGLLDCEAITGVEDEHSLKQIQGHWAHISGEIGMKWIRLAVSPAVQGLADGFVGDPFEEVITRKSDYRDNGLELMGR